AYAGLGEVDITAVTATPLSPVTNPPSPRERERATKPQAPPRVTSAAERLANRRDEATAAVRHATAEVKAAQGALADTIAAEQDADRAQGDAEREVERLRAELTQARFAVRAAQQRVATVRSERIAAEKAVAAA